MPEPAQSKPCPHCGQVRGMHASTCRRASGAASAPDNGHTVVLDVPVHGPIPDFDDEPEERPWADPVEHPSHYATGTIECIDAMREIATPEEFVGFCKLSAFKYIWRSNRKGSPVTDLRKASKYLEWAIDALTDDAAKEIT